MGREAARDKMEAPEPKPEAAEAEEAGEAAETLEDETSGADFQPIVQLQEVQVCSGEEDEEVLYATRGKLYRWGEDVKGEKMWKDRGTGEIKLLKHHDSGKIRVLLRVDKTKKIRLNYYIAKDLELKVNPTSDKAWTYIAVDYSDEEATYSSLCVKFKDPETANAFRDQWNAAREMVAAGDEGEDDKAEEEV